jgi:hypothetical protein
MQGIEKFGGELSSRPYWSACAVLPIMAQYKLARLRISITVPCYLFVTAHASTSLRT